ncbi:MAG: diacylglycerol kinase family lipid kinase [Nitrospirae bacterium]|nr:diacylglycerol kinase family lipid kinase [Nitrospirota bacterium]
MKNIVLIGNPAAGGGALKKIEKAASIIRDKGFDVRVLLTGKRGDAESFAREIASNSPTFKKAGQGGILVIAAGGDGTYNEVANGLIHSDVPMAVLPLGTSSVLAKELRLPGDIDKAVHIALNGCIQTVHVGKITLKDSDKLRVTSNGLKDKKDTEDLSPVTENVTRYFLLMAGIGFDAETVFGISERIKKYTGKAAYILSGIETVMKYNPSPLTIKGYGSPVANHESKGSGPLAFRPSSIVLTGYTAIIGKASCYGGNFKITPDASLTDPHFYVFVTHKKSRSSLIKYVAGIVKGFHLGFKDISYFRAAEIEVEGNAPIQIDGDYAGAAPAKIEIARDALKIVTAKDPCIQQL